MILAACLTLVCPAPKFSGSLTNNDSDCWDSVDWYDSRPKPTWEELCAVWPQVEKQMKAAVEADWVPGELAWVAEQLERHEDGESDLISTPELLREYRKAVKSWKDHPDFPEMSKRPERPHNSQTLRL